MYSVKYLLTLCIVHIHTKIYTDTKNTHIFKIKNNTKQQNEQQQQKKQAWDRALLLECSHASTRPEFASPASIQKAENITAHL